MKNERKDVVSKPEFCSNNDGRMRNEMNMYIVCMLLLFFYGVRMQFSIDFKRHLNLPSVRRMLRGLVARMVFLNQAHVKCSVRNRDM